MTQHRPHRLAASATALLVAASLAACAPGGSANTADQSAAPAEVVTDISSLPEQTLVVWDQETRGGQDAQMKALNEAFMKKYPNITIERHSQSFDDLETTLPLALTGKDAPDVVEANNSKGQMGKFVAGKQLVALTPWADAYKWGERFPESISNYWRYTADGLHLGEGDQYGAAQMGEVVGVFYNKAKLASLGLTVPATWDEFTAQLATIKAAGETPLMLGNIEKWPAVHVFGAVQGALVAPDAVRPLAFGNEGGDWTSAENVKAAATLQEWAKNGWFNEGFNGADYDDTWKAFAQGTGVYLIGGSWLGADLSDAMGEDVAFILPPANGSGTAATTGGTSLPFSITSAAKDKNVAAAYIDFITSPEAMTTLADTGNVPVLADEALASKVGGMTGEIITAFGAVSSANTILPYLDYATPTAGDDLGAALQQLLDGQTTPEDFAKDMQSNYEAFLATAK